MAKPAIRRLLDSVKRRKQKNKKGLLEKVREMNICIYNASVHTMTFGYCFLIDALPCFRFYREAIVQATNHDVGTAPIWLRPSSVT